MPYEFILTEKRAGAFVLTLNRPEKRNALNSRMWAELAQAIGEFEADDESRALIITNTGPCFCAGSDLKEIDAGTYHPPAGYGSDGFAAITGTTSRSPSSPPWRACAWAAGRRSCWHATWRLYPATAP